FDVDLNDFVAIVVHSDIKRTGWFSCGNPQINQLYHNIIWGQKSNYVDVPTDCPQRDERLGWTGDALAFMRTAAINYDVEDFFKKWLGEVALTQHDDGGVPGIVPEPIATFVSAAWGDAATHCPWEVYLAYGNKEILEVQFDSMKKWVEYMHNFGEEEFLWVGGQHYGDWLNMDGGKGYEDIDFQANDYIASVFFAYSTSLLIKAGEVLGKDVSEYVTLHENVVNALRARYFRDGVPALRTQTAYVLALCFDLCEDEYKEKCANTLVDLVEERDRLLSTGFVGTPKLMHALTAAGRNDIAYDLLLTDRFPSWLFSVKQGATTMWEHWDCIKEDGTFWSAGMNSFNHYAYGAVYDWIFGVAAGIKVCEDGPGYTHITIEPATDERLGYLRAGIDSRQGKIESHWYYKGDEIYFEFTVPERTVADITLPDGRKDTVSGGTFIYTVINK
ncbi:MAG: alfa-L-rhamnosidase, partial [Clostridia bacterium]|nr:alfa-L-rhamnosidase [Clostridia bacterium]